MLNEEGDLDNESEDPDFEKEMAILQKNWAKVQNRQSASSTSSRISTIAVRHESPMSLD